MQTSEVPYLWLRNSPTTPDSRLQRGVGIGYHGTRSLAAAGSSSRAYQRVPRGVATVNGEGAEDEHEGADRDSPGGSKHPDADERVAQ